MARKCPTLCVCVCVCVSTQVPAFLNGLRLGFSEFEVMNVFDECMCGENSLNISIYFFFFLVQRWFLEAFGEKM